MQSDEKTERFVSLLASNQHRILAFIQSIVFNRADSEDIMQDTSTIMWRKFDEYKPGTDFTAWGITIAKFRILEHKKKKKTFFLSDETLLLLANQSETMVPELEMRFEALEHCIKKLNSTDLKLLDLRFSSHYSAKDIANRVGTTLNMVYRHMSRIKSLLIHCVKKQLINMES